MHDSPLDTAARRISARLDALAACTGIPGEITRLFLTPAHADAIVLVRQWMEDAGLVTHLNASGTLVGRRGSGDANAPTLIVGSHIDTVRNAGRFDGCLGVVLAIEAASRLRATAYALEIRAFGDEEGVRFPVTLTTAHATAGTFLPEWLLTRDAAGITLAEALSDFDLDPAQLASGVCVPPSPVAYLELHIEQGRVLEMAAAPLGIVTAIAGAARFSIEIVGRAGHAGTTPMAGRQDALVAAAGMILAVRGIARARPAVVATVGTITVEPAAPNTIAGTCRFTVDLRAQADAEREDAEKQIAETLLAIARSEATNLTITRTHTAPATPCSPSLQALLANAVAASDLPVIHLASFAGHDAMAIASLCPVGMLFIRCAGGISHSPEESVSMEDIAQALAALLHALQHFSPGLP